MNSGDGSSADTPSTERFAWLCWGGGVAAGLVGRRERSVCRFLWARQNVVVRVGSVGVRHRKIKLDMPLSGASRWHIFCFAWLRPPASRTGHAHASLPEEQGRRRRGSGARSVHSLSVAPPWACGVSRSVCVMHHDGTPADEWVRWRPAAGWPGRKQQKQKQRQERKVGPGPAMAASLD